MLYTMLGVIIGWAATRGSTGTLEATLAVAQNSDKWLTGGIKQWTN